MKLCATRALRTEICLDALSRVIKSFIMWSPLVSCIIPAYNAEPYLAEAIDSIVAQSYASTEIIVVDDGSTDATGSVIAGYGHRVVALRQDNAGPAAALNAGIRIATGELVAFLDADDVWIPDKLTQQLARFEAHPAIDITYGHAQNFWDAEMAAPTARLNDRLAEPFPAPGLSMLARRQVFDSVGLFNQTRGHGFAIEWMLLARERGVVVDQVASVLVRRRLHATNRSRQLAANSREEFLHLMKEYLDRRRRAEQ